MAGPRKVWLSFIEAREWARSLGLNSEAEWREYRKNGLPSGIPTNPNRSYANVWISWGDFLGTGRIADKLKTYRTYQEASDWAKSKNIRTLGEWREQTKNKEFPSDIPMVPYNTYQSQWTNWGDFLQTGYVHYTQRRRLAFEEAQEWARRLGVLRRDDWYDLARNGLMPPEIPVHPPGYYADWKGWQHFLGNSIRGGSSIIEIVISNEIGQFISVDDKIRKIKFRNGRCKRIDIAIPSKNLIIEYDGSHWHKNLVLKDKLDNTLLADVGWKVLRIREIPLKKISDLDILVSAKDSLFSIVSRLIIKLIDATYLKIDDNIKGYLSSGQLSIKSIGLQKANWLTYKEAKDWVRKLDLTSEAAWRKYKKNHNLPSNIPSAPEDAYRTEWQGWGDFLGTGNLASKKFLRPFSEAREYVRSLKIKDARDYRTACVSGNIPDDIARRPHNAYREWVSWMDWLGTEKTARNKREWIEFEDAVKIARSLNLKSESDWRRMNRMGSRPSELPASPAYVYKNFWLGWGHWLGTGNVSRIRKN